MTANMRSSSPNMRSSGPNVRSSKLTRAWGLTNGFGFARVVGLRGIMKQHKTEETAQRVLNWLPRLVQHWLLRLVRSCGFVPAIEVKVLEEKLKRAESSRQWYAHRCDMLQREQKRFGAGKARTLLCDILANGQLLPDPKGKRYPSSNTQDHARNEGSEE